jgi:hypothetical protein
VLSLNCAARLFQFYFSVDGFPPSPPLIRIILQGGDNIGDNGARAIADAMRTGADVTTLLARVPGKPNDLFGLDCGKTKLLFLIEYPRL